jgi:UDP-N-acetylmuramoyl-L-alanyl-D-glutamate--2,6-diaminopimelate ligase
MKYAKYHGLGNDYIVMSASELSTPLTREMVRRICDRNLGAGSDGIVLVEKNTPAGFIVRIFNPDGSEAENSGNGMRIVARYLFDTKQVGREPFNLLVKGERKITAHVLDARDAIEVDMGQAVFLSSVIPVAGEEREVLGEKLNILGEELTINCVNVGNPHCVIVGRPDIKDGAQRLGPFIEVHEKFPKRINVQFVHVIDRSNIRIEIWERGAGYTLASGSSSCAAVSVCRRLGLVNSDVTVKMPGGELKMSVSDDYKIKLTGPITRVASGEIDPEVFLWGAQEERSDFRRPVSDLIPDECCTSESLSVLRRATADQLSVTGITSDSRAVKPGDLFFAIHGAKHDARLLINEAFDKGAKAVVYEGNLPLPPKGVVIPVVDIRRALSYAAHRFFGEPSLRTTNIGITGTSGKTSVAWILSHALHILGKKTFLGGTLGYATLQSGDTPSVNLKELGNTTIDPIMVHRFLSDELKSGVQAAVFEATSQGVVQRRMRDVAWDGVIFTNLTRDHMDLHGTMEAYEAAKRELFTTDLMSSPKRSRFTVINIDDVAGQRIASELKHNHKEISVMTLSRNPELKSDFCITDLTSTAAGIEYDLKGQGETLRIKANFIGDHNAYNLGCAALALCALGFKAPDITRALELVPAVPGRLEPVSRAKIPVFIDYAHKPDALEKVLKFLRPVCAGKLISVFGCGGDRDTGKRPVMGEISARLADKTIVTSDNPRSEDPKAIIEEIVSGIPMENREKLVIEADRRKAIELAIGMATERDIVLVAGKGHETYQEIKGVKYPFSDPEVCAEVLGVSGTSA